MDIPPGGRDDDRIETVPRPTVANLPGFRRRIIGALLLSTATGGLGIFTVFTVANVLVAELLGGPRWSGLGGTLLLLGSAGASVLLAGVMSRKGRRPGLVLGFGIGVAGAGVSVAGVSGRSLFLLLLGMLLFGAGSASVQLSRYAAADVVEADRRGKAISLVAWASTIGAVVGPNVVSSSGRAAGALGLQEVTGPFLVGAAGFILASAILAARLRPDPLAVAGPRGQMSAPAGRLEEQTPTPGARPWGTLLGLPGVQIAIVAMVAGQLVMVMVMSMTAVNMRADHHSWRAVGIVISGHIFGMYALSPVAGWASDRFGRIPVIAAGATTIIAATVLAASAPSRQATLIPALFLLGLGWNLGNVAGSALLTDSVGEAERPRLQGNTEFLVSATSAASGLASGVIMAAVGFVGLSLLGAILTVVVLAVVAGRRRALIECT